MKININTIILYTAMHPHILILTHACFLLTLQSPAEAITVTLIDNDTDVIIEKINRIQVYDSFWKLKTHVKLTN